MLASVGPNGEPIETENSIRAFASNLLDFDDRQLNTDPRRIKILKQLRLKCAILKPDKGNGVVLMKIDDYRHCMTDLFSDATKFSKVTHDSSITQLTTF